MIEFEQGKADRKNKMTHWLLVWEILVDYCDKQVQKRFGRYGKGGNGNK